MISECNNLCQHQSKIKCYTKIQKDEFKESEDEKGQNHFGQKLGEKNIENELKKQLEEEKDILLELNKIINDQRIEIRGLKESVKEQKEEFKIQKLLITEMKEKIKEKEVEIKRQNQKIESQSEIIKEQIEKIKKDDFIIRIYNEKNFSENMNFFIKEGKKNGISSIKKILNFNRINKFS